MPLAPDLGSTRGRVPRIVTDIRQHGTIDGHASARHTPRRNEWNRAGRFRDISTARSTRTAWRRPKPWVNAWPKSASTCCFRAILAGRCRRRADRHAHGHEIVVEPRLRERRMGFFRADPGRVQRATRGICPLQVARPDYVIPAGEHAPIVRAQRRLFHRARHPPCRSDPGDGHHGACSRCSTATRGRCR